VYFPQKAKDSLADFGGHGKTVPGLEDQQSATPDT
jgi:hypothetical protein